MEARVSSVSKLFLMNEWPDFSSALAGPPLNGAALRAALAQDVSEGPRLAWDPAAPPLYDMALDTSVERLVWAPLAPQGPPWRQECSGLALELSRMRASEQISDFHFAVNLDCLLEVSETNLNLNRTVLGLPLVPSAAILPVV